MNQIDYLLEIVDFLIELGFELENNNITGHWPTQKEPMITITISPLFDENLVAEITTHRHSYFRRDIERIDDIKRKIQIEIYQILNRTKLVDP